MTDETEIQLSEARHLLGQCARKISSKPHPLLDADAEMLIGFGTAGDWIRWAVSLLDLKFRQAEERSARKAGITELVRFNQIWTAANALFAKESILNLIPSFQPLTKAKKEKIEKSEIKRFIQLYKFACIDRNVEATCLNNLHHLLSMRCNAEGVEGIFAKGDTKKHAYPQTKPKPLPTMWEVIDKKYSRPLDRTRGIGKSIATALQSKTLPVVDGPTLIYATRNWAVHGVLQTSFFRGSRKKFTTYIDNVGLLLSAAVRGSADEFLKIL